MRLRFNSLSVRLALSAALWTLVAIAAAGIILTSLYRRAAERTFDENLDNYYSAIVGAITQQWPNEITSVDNLSEPLFGSVYSGWYWQISSEGQVVLKSQSLLFDALAVPDNAPPRDDQGFVRFTTTGPGGETIRAIESSTTINNQATYRIVVSGNATALGAEIATFRTSVIVTLAVFGVALILSTFLVIRWGLRPLDRVRQGLAALRSGKQTRLTGNYPAEIAPLAMELNALLESNQQVHRAGAHAGRQFGARPEDAAQRHHQ